MSLIIYGRRIKKENKIRLKLTFAIIAMITKLKIKLRPYLVRGIFFSNSHQRKLWIPQGNHVLFKPKIFIFNAIKT